jgi:hypothetical protein
VDEYDTNDGYGGLAGFGGPALEGQNAPVVRYQDLHRSHAPASAGAPETGFGDVAMSAPETGVYGDVAVVEGAQQAAPTYGGMGAMRPLYGDAAATANTAAATNATKTEQKTQRDSSLLADVGRGLASGFARETGVSRFEDSGKSTAPIAQGTRRDRSEKPEWQTYAIWGGATVLGVGAAYLLYRSYSKAKGA